MENKESLKKYSLYTATAIVISNMIGSGVFTSLGFQVFDIKSVPPLLALWIVGGIVATCGALTYGELASAFPKSGGEYNFLTKLYHPIAGFLSGYVSATVGFAAPIALAAMALGRYMGHIFPNLTQPVLGIIPSFGKYVANGSPEMNSMINSMFIGCFTVIVIALVHLAHLKLSGNFQKIITSTVVVLILSLIAAGLLFGSSAGNPAGPLVSDFKLTLSSAFAVSLIYVSYAYSGWNSASYIIEDIRNPQKNVPLALLFGTLIVMVLYVLMNFTFLYIVPIPELVGKVEVGFIAATKIFGTNGGLIISLLISICLLSAVSGMTLVGPRVTQSIYKNVLSYKYNLEKIEKSEKKDVPLMPILFQTSVALFLIITYTFEQVLTYIGFTLSLFCTFTVAGIFILRTKFKDVPRVYKTWGYPVTPIIFILFEFWMLYHLWQNKNFESLAGLATILSGIPVYFLLQYLNNKIYKNKFSVIDRKLLVDEEA